jgi:hypothetical protein
VGSPSSSVASANSRLPIVTRNKKNRARLCRESEERVETQKLLFTFAVISFCIL